MLLKYFFRFGWVGREDVSEKVIFDLNVQQEGASHAKI